MKRWMLRIVVFLLLGAIVNVAVAWGCALYSIGQPQEVLIPMEDGTRYRAIIYAGYGMMRINWLEQVDPALFHAANPKYKQKLMQLPVRRRPSWSKGKEHSMCEDCRGWPLRCMRYAIERSGFFEARFRAAKGEIALSPRDGARPIRLEGVRALPVEMIYPSFAFNVLFYAGILWLLFAAPFALRRRRRIRRGLCPACAYPVGTWGGSPVCTECGKAVTPRRGVGL